MIESIRLKSGKNFIYDTKQKSWYISDRTPRKASDDTTEKTPILDKLLSKPPFLEIVFNTSYRCNLKCDYCYMHKDNRKEPIEHTLNLLFNQLKNADRNTTVLFHGGESLQYFNFIKNFVEKCERLTSGHAILFQLQTNATLITEDIAAFLKKHNFSVCISIDGTEAITNAHRKFHNGKGAFKNILKGIDYLKKQNVKFTMISVLTKDFGDAFMANIDFLRNVGAEKYQINPLINAATNTFDSDSATKVFEYLLNDELAYSPICKEESLSIRALQLIGLNTGDACEGIPCDMGRSVISVDSYGNIYPCEMFVGDKMHIQGNINKDNLFNHWQNPKLRMLQKHIIETSKNTCGDCPLSRFRTCACSFNILKESRKQYHDFVVFVTDKIIDAMRYDQTRLKNVIAND